MNVAINDFMIESFSLLEFETIITKKDDLISNIIKSRFEKGAKLFIIGYEIIKERIYFFIRWEEF